MAEFELVDCRYDWRERVIPLILREGHPICANKLARKLGWERANDKIYKYLKELVSAGLLVTPIPGLYFPPQGKDSASSDKTGTKPGLKNP